MDPAIAASPATTERRAPLAAVDPPIDPSPLPNERVPDTEPSSEPAIIGEERVPMETSDDADALDDGSTEEGDRSASPPMSPVF